MMQSLRHAVSVRTLSLHHQFNQLLLQSPEKPDPSMCAAKSCCNAIYRLKKSRRRVA